MSLMTEKRLTTAVIGSYPQPPWLVDHEVLKQKIVPRTRAKDIWRIPEPLLREAQKDATLLAIRDQEKAGIDVITDGEIRRESYSNHFATALEGLDLDSPAIVTVQNFEMALPRVVGKLGRPKPVAVEDLKFLKEHTNKLTKMTLPGPFTLSKQAVDEFYGDPEELAMAYADLVNQEARDLERAGADVIQLDEPWLRQDPEGASKYAIRAIDAALRDIKTETAIHLCFGYGFVVGKEKPNSYAFLEELSDCCVNQISVEAAQAEIDLGVLRGLSEKRILLGVLDLSTNQIEKIETVRERIEKGLVYVPSGHLIPSPDCGMKDLARASAFAKLQVLTEATRQINEKLDLT